MPATVSEININVGGRDVGAGAVLDNTGKKLDSFGQKVKEWNRERRASGELAVDRLVGGSGEKALDYLFNMGPKVAIATFAFRGLGAAATELTEHLEKVRLAEEGVIEAAVEAAGKIPVFGDALKSGWEIGKAIRAVNDPVLATIEVLEERRRAAEAFQQSRERSYSNVGSSPAQREAAYTQIALNAEIKAIYAAVPQFEEAYDLILSAKARYRLKVYDIQRKEKEDTRDAQQSLFDKSEQDRDLVRANIRSRAFREQGDEAKAAIELLYAARRLRQEEIAQEGKDFKKSHPELSGEYIDKKTKERQATSAKDFDDQIGQRQRQGAEDRLNHDRDIAQKLLDIKRGMIEAEFQYGTAADAAKAREELRLLKVTEEYEQKKDAAAAIMRDKQATEFQKSQAQKLYSQLQKDENAAMEHPFFEGSRGGVAANEQSNHLTGLIQASREGQGNYQQKIAKNTEDAAKSAKDNADSLQAIASALNGFLGLSIPTFN